MSNVVEEQDLKEQEETKEAIQEDIQKNSEELQAQAQELQKKLQEGVRFNCSIHGDVNKSTTVIPYEENGKIVRKFYCNQCLTEMLDKMVADTKMGEVKIGISKNLLSDLGVTEEELQKFASEQEEEVETSDPQQGQ